MWHYEGSQWNMFKKFSIDGYPFIGIENFYGDSPNNIYAVGTAFPQTGNEYIAFISHYDGKDWNLVNTKGLKAGLFMIYKDSRITNLYFIRASVDTEQGELCKVYIFDGTALKEIYSAPETYHKAAWISQLNDQVYIVIDQKIYKYQNDQMILWKDFTGTQFHGMIWGRSEKDFFFNNTTKGIGHYNGTDLVTVHPTFYISSAVILESKVFFHLFDKTTGRNLILTGTLK